MDFNLIILSLMAVESMDYQVNSVLLTDSNSALMATQSYYSV